MILRLDSHSFLPLEQRRRKRRRPPPQLVAHTGLLLFFASFLICGGQANEKEPPASSDPDTSFSSRRLPPVHGGPLANRLSLPPTRFTLLPHHPPKHSDLHPSAQTLYDLRGFHIPLGGQEETQRYLRQQNELEQAQRSKPLVFPSFFQPQTPAYNQHSDQQQPPHSLNIFGHNQHHQQTSRYVLGPQPERDTTFRPSQPDLSLPSTTESFKPIPSPQPTPQQNEIRDEKGLDDFVYVYDYEEDPPQQQREIDKLRPSPTPQTSTQIRANQPTAVVIESTPHPSPAPAQQFLNQNHFEVDSRRVQPLNQNFYNPNSYQQPLIEASPFPPRPPPGPRVEIVPSSERKPPPDQSNAIQTNLREVVREQKSHFEEATGKGVNEFKPSIRFLPPPPPTQFVRGGQQNFISPPPPPTYFGRNSNPSQSPRPLVFGHDYDGRLVQQELPPGKYSLQEFVQDQLPNNPGSTRDLLHPPQQQQQRLQPVTSVFPQRFIEPTRETYVLEEEVPELVEVYREPVQQTTTSTERPTTQSTTTLRPFRRNPFPPRHRLQATTTTEATTTTAAPRVRRPRPRPTSRTTTPPPLEDISENYVYLAEEESDEDIGRIKSYEAPVRRVPPLTSARATPSSIIRNQRPQFEESTSLHPNFADEQEQELVIIQPPTRSPFVQQTAIVQGQGLQERAPTRGRFISSHPRITIPPVKSTGKPLYPNASDKEGGLYSDYFIPIGHVYGSPIPFLPINQVFERMPGLFEEGGGFGNQLGRQVSSTRAPPQVLKSTIEKQQSRGRGPQQNQQQTVSQQTSRARNPVTRQTTTTTPKPPVVTTSTPVRTTQPFRSQRVYQEAQTSPAPDTEQPRRRRIRPRVDPSVSSPTGPTAPSRFVPKQTQPKNPILRSTIPVPPSLEVSLPVTPKPNPLKRRVKFRVTTSTTTTTTTTTTTPPPPTEPTIIEYDEPPPPKPTRRKVVKKHRPTTTLRSFPQPRHDEDDSMEDEEDSDEQPVRVLKRPSDRFSSKYREDPPLDLIEVTTARPPSPPPEAQLPIRLTKPKKVVKISPTTRRTTTPDPPPPPTTDREVLPSSVLLRPKDVLQNRKPARRIPPGSASDKLKALQERRRNLLRGNKLSPTPSRAAAPSPKTTTATRKRLEEPLSLEVHDDEEEEDEEDYSDAEPSKREIKSSSVNSHLLRNSSLFKSRPTGRSKSEVTSEEQEAVLRIQKPSPLSIVEWFKQPSSREEPSLAESVRVEEATTIAASAKDPARRVVTMSPSFSMSTNEPSLPLEAFFPILSGGGGSSREKFKSS